MVGYKDLDVSISYDFRINKKRTTHGTHTQIDYIISYGDYVYVVCYKVVFVLTLAIFARVMSIVSLIVALMSFLISR